VFQSFFASAAQFIREFRETGELGVMRLMGGRETPVGVVDADEVGVVAAHLLVQEDTAKHKMRKYVLNGPEAITGEGIVRLVEGIIGVSVPEQNVRYQEHSWLDGFLEAEYMGAGISRNVVMSTKRAAPKAWDASIPTVPTSQELMEIAAPKRTPEQMLKSLLGG
jgi:uncharacterized protein YbjT (DUF2867 family)